ncbi:hypothetical protein, partial [Estrella lausannensis]|uniref:hypothetical protein n=1 Tax=Estrella lausannensis TaxID=483423 RepID=UPI00195297AB
FYRGNSKYKVLRLSNPELESEINEFEKIVKTLPDSLFDKNFPVSDKQMKTGAKKAFEDSATQIEVFYKKVHNQLLEIFNFQNKT